MPVTAEQRAVSEREAKFARDDLGGLLPNPRSYAHVLTYDGDKVETDVFTDGVFIWTQTYTYTGENLTGISQWVRTEA